MSSSKSNPISFSFDVDNNYVPRSEANDVGLFYQVKRKNWLRQRMKPRTQKVRGIRALNIDGVRPNWGYTPNFDVIQKASDIRKAVITYPVFVRPCPVTPCHGFVDSKIVHNVQELSQVWTDARLADPKAELVLMTPIKCESSMVLTNNCAAIGPGNNGATSGINSITLPLAVPLKISRELEKVAGVPTDEAPYYEVLRSMGQYGDEEIWPVQCRAGPMPVSGSGDFVPYENFIVTNIIGIPKGTEPDLLEFAKFAGNAIAGTVIYHPGGTRLSHYAVHGLTNNIAVLFGDTSPSIGDKLEQTSATIQYDMASICKGISHGYNVSIDDKDDMANAVHASIYGLHHASALHGSYSFVLGMAIGLFVRCSFAACIGELRHSNSDVIGNVFSLSTYADERDRYADDDDVDNLHDRGSVYNAAFNNLGDAWQLLHDAYECFQFEDHDGGYGGGNWANCSIATIKFVNEVTNFQKERKTVTGLIEAFNKAVNQVHNNGWMLNKFVSSHVLDQLAAGDPYCTVKALFAAYGYARITRDLNVGNTMLESIDYRKPTVSLQYDRDESEETGRILMRVGYRGNHVRVKVDMDEYADLYGFLKHIKANGIITRRETAMTADSSLSIATQVLDEANWQQESVFTDAIKKVKHNG